MSAPTPDRAAWRWWRLPLCLVGWHDNALCRALGWAPLFPIKCDACGALYYHTRASHVR